MKYLKSFESINYGDKHFGIHVFDYTPWIKYPKSIREAPNYDRKKVSFFMDWFGETPYSFMTLYWVKTGEFWTYNIGPSDDRDDYTNFDSTSIYFDTYNSEVTIDRRKIDVDDWEDVVKLQLIIALGKKSRSQEYLNLLQDGLEIYEIFEDYDISSDNGIDSRDYKIMSLSSAISNNYLHIDDDTLKDFIKNYEGNVEFYKSLKSYMEKNGNLTYNQLRAMRQRPSTEMFKHIGKDRICIIFMDKDLEVGIGPRLKNMGFESIGNIFYK